MQSAWAKRLGCCLHVISAAMATSLVTARAWGQGAEPAPGGAGATEAPPPAATDPDDDSHLSFWEALWKRTTLDANVTAARMTSNDAAVAGDARFAYRGKRFGLSGYGEVNFYDFHDDVVDEDNLRAGGGGEAWVSFGDKQLSLDLIANGAGLLYHNDHLRKVSPVLLYGQDSVMGRGNLFGSVHAQPSSRLLFEATGGGGFQYEFYDIEDIKLQGAAQQDLFKSTTTTTTTFHAEGRLLFRYKIAPDTLAMRLRARGDTFSLSRTIDKLSLGTTGAVGGSVETLTFRQTEVSARLFFDVIALKLFDITPALYGGLDYYALTSSDASKDSVIYLGGVGLFKQID